MPKGVCATGTQSCTMAGDWGQCTGVTLPRAEQCDGRDDDCDGTVDEDYGVRVVDCGVGACLSHGTERCTFGLLLSTCRPNPPSFNDAICNGVDDDCDGVTDEDYVGTPTHCGVGACGACQLTLREGEVCTICTQGPAVDLTSIPFPE